MTAENVWRRNVELGLNIKTYHATPLAVLFRTVVSFSQISDLFNPASDLIWTTK